MGKAFTALLLGALLGAALSAHVAAAQPVRIGVLNDQSGMYADLSGPAPWLRRAWPWRTSAAPCSGGPSR